MITVKATLQGKAKNPANETVSVAVPFTTTAPSLEKARERVYRTAKNMGFSVADMHVKEVR